MRKKLVNCLLIFLFAFSFVAQAAQSARIHGDVYDLSLDRVENVVVLVNTTPNQRLISRNGTYSFNLPVGSYMITALEIQNNRTKSKATEKVQAVDEGDYVIDLFLYPDLDDEKGLLNSTDIPPPQKADSTWLYFAAVIILLSIMGAGYMLYTRRANPAGSSDLPLPHPSVHAEGLEPEVTEPEENAEEEKPVGVPSADTPKSEPTPAEPYVDDELKNVIDIIRQEGGRTTQKEIRKHLPLSEAKVSLIITEMEAKGLIEKIKKGRGNIIILKKKD